MFLEFMLLLYTDYKTIPQCSHRFIRRQPHGVHNNMLANRPAVPSGCVRKTGIGSANLNGGHHAVIVVIGVEQRLPATHPGGGLCHTNTLDIQQSAISEGFPT